MFQIYKQTIVEVFACLGSSHGFCAKRFFHPWDKKIRCPFVRADNNYFLRTESGGGTHAAGPWWFEL